MNKRKIKTRNSLINSTAKPSDVPSHKVFFLNRFEHTTATEKWGRANMLSFTYGQRKYTSFQDIPTEHLFPCYKKSGNVAFSCLTRNSLIDSTAKPSDVLSHSVFPRSV